MNKQMQEVIDKFEALSPLPLERLSAESARQQPELRDAVLGVLNDHVAKRLVGGIVEDVAEMEHIEIPGPAGPMLARVYKPNKDSNLPLTLYFHGGGFVIAGLNSYDSSCRALCNAAETIVVSLAYRQAPEHRYPAAHEDAFAAYRWLVRNAVSLGADPSRIAIAGESAGGNLAASTCLRARDERLPLPVHQLLVYPVVDNDMSRPSYLEHADAKPLNRRMMKWFFEQVTDTSAPGTPDPYLLPIHGDLRGLPAATVILAEIDPLCSEGEDFARHLSAAGVEVATEKYEGVAHEFFGMGAVVSEGKSAVRFAAQRLRESFYPDRMDTPLPSLTGRFDERDIALGYPA